MAGLLHEEVAVVTGGAQGIGRAVCERYAAEGARVAVVDIDLTGAEEVASGIRERGGAAVSIGCDVTDREAVFAAADRVISEYGKLSVLVSNAGVVRAAMLWKMTPEQWSDVMSTHVTAAFNWLQAVVPPMREAGHGRIILTTSAAGIIGTIGQINYATAKAALLGMTRSAAKELAPSGITVNAVAPNAATSMTQTIREDERFKDKYLSEIPLSRWADAEEVAGTYCFLASPDAAYMTGQVLSVDGGRVMVR